MTETWCLQPKKIIYKPDDEFFVPLNLTCKSLCKWSCYGDQEAVSYAETVKMPCGYCQMVFDSSSKLEDHFKLQHENHCSICSARFPTARLLDLHLSETHDNYFKTLAKSTKMYCCLVDGCGKKFWNDERRKLHLMAKHSFPESFTFHPELKKSWKNRKQPCKHFAHSGKCIYGGRCRFLHVRPTSNTQSKNDEDIEMEVVTSKLREVKIKVPDKISFGRHKKR